MMKYDYVDYVMATIITILAVFMMYAPFLFYYSAVHQAELWNRCHPSTTITTKQAFYARPEIAVCETGVLAEDES